jgi:hypothetical protein
MPTRTATPMETDWDSAVSSGGGIDGGKGAGGGRSGTECIMLDNPPSETDSAFHSSTVQAAVRNAARGGHPSTPLHMLVPFSFIHTTLKSDGSSRKEQRVSDGSTSGEPMATRSSRKVQPSRMHRTICNVLSSENRRIVARSAARIRLFPARMSVVSCCRTIGWFRLSSAPGSRRKRINCRRLRAPVKTSRHCSEERV